MYQVTEIIGDIDPNNHKIIYSSNRDCLRFK
jgi:hypothetical protein